MAYKFTAESNNPILEKCYSFCNIWADETSGQNESFDNLTNAISKVKTAFVIATNKTLNPMTLKTLAVSSLLLFNFVQTFACSMYKVTSNGKTVIGCNHDTWFLTPRIWFENTGFGAGFTGARFDGNNGVAPQSGMNEFGLAFSRLAAATPTKETVGANKKPISNPTLFLKNVLHSFKTVEEVKNYVDQFDHSVFIQDVLIYVDQSGKYLIVEPYKTILGNDPKYVLANFCPSEITDFNSIKQERYINGTTFLKNNNGSDINFFTALSDTMHVCRKKIGDGTLLTSIWDTNSGEVNLYFYHNYKHRVKFNLKEELAKGDHFFEVPTLFPKNKEFERLSEFKTPLNSKEIDRFLMFSSCLFLFSACYFPVSYLRKKSESRYKNLKLLLFPLSLVMLYFMFVLATEMGFYYYPAPYKDYKFSSLTIVAYVPFLILLLIFPFALINKNILKEKSWSFFGRWLFTINNLVYIILIILFVYWGFYNVFS